MMTEIGPHRVRCGSVMDDLDGLLRGERADLIYTDPPWGQGNVRYWQTINQRQTGAERQDIEFGAFLARVFDVLARYAAGPVFVEYGIRWRPEIESQTKRCSFRIELRCPSLYASGSNLLPLDFYVLSRQPLAIPAGYADMVGRLKGKDLPIQATAPFATAGGIILDPMCGMGYTAEAARRHGMRFRGNELNRHRLEKTIARLRRP
jgi:hypothetical protein